MLESLEDIAPQWPHRRMHRIARMIEGRASFLQVPGLVGVVPSFLSTMLSCGKNDEINRPRALTSMLVVACPIRIV
jgi:hypothetical protein